MTDPVRLPDSWYFLRELERRLTEIDDPFLMEQLVVDTIGQRLGVNRCSFIEINGDSCTLRYNYRSSDDWPAMVGTFSMKDYTIPGTAELLRQGIPLIIDDVWSNEFTKDFAALHEKRGVASMLVIPILRQREWIASLSCTSGKPRHWEPFDVELLSDSAFRSWIMIERARAIKELQTANRRLANAQIAAQCGVWEADLRSGDLYFSPEFCEMMGLDASKSYRIEDGPSMCIPEDLPRMRELFRRNIESRSPSWTDSFRFIHPKKGMRAQLSRGDISYDDAGVAVNMIGVSIDITEQRQLEQELVQKEQTLKELDQRKSYFIATLAHELRNPLAPLVSGLDVLRIEEEKEIRQYTFDAMERQLKHMVRLVDDLLDVNRIDRGLLRLNKEKVDLDQIIDQAVETVAMQFKRKNQRFVLNRSCKNLLINGDRDRLVQVCSNLLNNASKFTPVEGQVELGVYSQNGEVVVTVSDTGEGIAKEDIPTMFEMFKQIPSNGRLNTGLGLGLSIAKHLVEGHGGSIEVFSTGRGDGATFTVRLPVQ
jgi:PAS domain S-box-containing protein